MRMLTPCMQQRTPCKHDDSTRAPVHAYAPGAANPSTSQPSCVRLFCCCPAVALCWGCRAVPASLCSRSLRSLLSCLALFPLMMMTVCAGQIRTRGRLHRQIQRCRHVRHRRAGIAGGCPQPAKDGPMLRYPQCLPSGPQRRLPDWLGGQGVRRLPHIRVAVQATGLGTRRTHCLINACNSSLI